VTQETAPNPEIIERLMDNAAPSYAALSTETGLAAASFVKALADAERVEWALLGGLAMHLYGFVRATKDIDFVASRELPLEAVRHLTFGGASYQVEAAGKQIIVDWIVRRDDWRGFYEAALAEAITLPNGWRVVSPEWLALLKYIAGRPKDEIDLLWLLQQKGLVDRRLLRSHLARVVGPLQARLTFREIERRYFALADSGVEGDENDSYRPEYPEYNDD
jgi:hypothetical protein